MPNHVKEQPMDPFATPTTTVAVTVSGDARTATVEADTSTALADLLPSWAAQCSTRPPAELVVLSGATAPTLVDPDASLTDLALGYGTVLRLLTSAQALALLEPAVATPELAQASPAPDTEVGKPAAPAEQSTSPLSRLAGSEGLVRPPAAAESTLWTTPEGGPHSAARVPARAAASTGPSAGALPVKVPTTRRLSQALKAALTVRGAEAPPVGAFGKNAAAPKAAERYRQAMADTDRVANLERMIRQAPLPRCMVIGVVSPKGGAGKTTITALLGTLLAELRRDPVLALDANPDFGNLQDKLGVAGQAAGATDEFYRWLEATPAATPADLSARLGVGPHGLRYLPTPTGDLPRMVAAADFGLYHGLLARLRDYEGIILVDCGTGLLDPPVRAALETADQILLVTDSSADTAGLVVKAAQYLPPSTPTWLVANKMPARGAMVDLDRVAGAISQLKGVTVVPEQRLTENIVTPRYDWAQAPAAWQEPLREIGARLASDWRSQPCQR